MQACIVSSGDADEESKQAKQWYSHKESLDFFSSQYRLNWEKGYPGKSIEWHFVWVVREDEAIKKRDEYPQRIKYGTTPVTVHVRSFKEMSAELDFL